MSARVTAGAAVSGTESSAVEPAPAPRAAPLALARMHLRLGSLALARAELEILAREQALDGPGRVDLAEARWRTGDLASAGAAATLALDAGEEGPVALAIAAEAAAALGRPNEARRLANRAMECIGGPIDSLFAGMPRSAVWPADADEPPPTPGTLFHQEPASPVKLRAGDTDPAVTAGRASADDDWQDPTARTPRTPGFWDADGAGEIPRNDLPDPAGELDAARAALRAGALDEAVLRLTLALRLAPALAPAILEATDGIPGPAISVIRGDAYRQVGLEGEARRAYAAAAWSGTRDRRRRKGRGRATVEGRATPAETRPAPEETQAAPAEAEATGVGTPGTPPETPASSPVAEQSAPDARRSETPASSPETDARRSETDARRSETDARRSETDA